MAVGSQRLSDAYFHQDDLRLGCFYTNWTAPRLTSDLTSTPDTSYGQNTLPPQNEGAVSSETTSSGLIIERHPLCPDDDLKLHGPSEAEGYQDPGDGRCMDCLKLTSFTDGVSMHGDRETQVSPEQYNATGTLTGRVHIRANLGTGPEQDSGRWKAPVFRVVIEDSHSKSELFSIHKTSHVPPVLAFHPHKSRVFSLMTYSLSQVGVTMETYDVRECEPRCIHEKRIPDVDADGDSVSHLRYDRAGEWLVVVILEQLTSPDLRLIRMFILDPETFRVVLKPKAASLSVCHSRCVEYARPVFSRCNSYVMVASSRHDQAYVHKLPETLNLALACRRRVLRNLLPSNRCVNDVIASLEIPRSLKRLLLFDPS